MKYKAKTKDGRIIEGYYVPVNYGEPVIVRSAYQNEDGSIEWVYEPVVPESLEVAQWMTL